MKHLFTGIIAALFISFAAFSQQSLQEDVVSFIKQEAFENSQLNDFIFYLSDYAGPRLTASQLGLRAETIALNMLENLGFQNIRIEKAAVFPRGGWDNLRTYAAMTAPYYVNFAVAPRAWTGSTDGLVSGEVVLLEINTPEDIEKFRGTLGGRIVLMPPTQTYTMQFTPLATRFTDEELAHLATDHRQPAPPPPAAPAQPTQPAQPRAASTPNLNTQIRALLNEEQPAVLITGSGVFNVPRTLGGNHRHGDPEPIAELALSVEAHGLMVRLMRRGVPVSMDVEVRNVFTDNQIVSNIFAEITGTDPDLKHEVVYIGGHLDSWHGGTGATDNASGCAVMIEALRIIQKSGVAPRRTIRLALWGGEEQGLIGSREYVHTNFFDIETNMPREAYNNFALYLNMDNGSGMFRGIFLQENDGAFPFFEEWIKPLAPIGFGVLSPRNTGNTDHVPFDRVGLPAFQFIQDRLEYQRALHTVMDTYERLIFEDLRHNVAVVAVLALSAAMDDGKIPPKPHPGMTQR